MVNEIQMGNQQDDLSRYVEDEDMISRALVLEELNRMVTSRHFRTSRRCKEFLQYVVNQKISGDGELLKERLIGVQIFGRKPDYAVGEDPVVRVLAGDVRHRLERYHADPESQSEIVIEIPLGSYAPVFRLRKDIRAGDETSKETLKKDGRLETNRASANIPLIDHGYGTTPSTPDELPGSSTYTSESNDQQSVLQPHSDVAAAPRSEDRRRVIFKRVGIPIVLCLMLAGYLVSSYFHRRPDPTLKAFWLPASLSPKPVLLWLPQPMLYRPSGELFERYRKSHPDALVTREARADQYLPLDPTDTIQWRDMIPVHDSGPGIGGVIAAINMSKLLTQQGIPFEIRFGPEASYAEMRDSPAVIVGAINTDWATQLTSESNFAFDESIKSPNIYETKGAKRVWKMEVIDGHKTRDYGLITRQLSGKAGQFLVQVAGVSHFGTEAASEMLMEKDELEKILHSQSISLQKKNLQIVVSTDITNGRAGPPQVVAVGSW